MSLANLFHIGHCGNFIIEKTHDKDTKPSTPTSVNLYDDMFSFQGALSDLDQVQNIEQTFTSVLTGGHNIKMLTFGLDSIFSAQKAFPLSELESLSLFKYLDLGSPMAGFRLPKVLSLPSAKGR